MTQIEQICAEIEHQLTICKKSVIESNKNDFPLNSSMHTGEEIAYTKMLDFINSLPQESASEDLEDVSKKYSSCIYLEEVLSDDDKEVLKKRLVNTFKAGANWQKEQMMKDAKEGIVTDKGDFIKFIDGTWVDLDPTLGNTPAFSLKEGQNVKLIVIKED